MILVSACLCGLHCRYDCGGSLSPEIVDLLRKGLALPVCPEQLGGLPTPRPPAEIQGGDGAAVLAGTARVYGKNGADFTDAFIKGAQETLLLARACAAERAILKARSPSCGCGRIYDGAFSGKLIAGDGVTAALLLQNGVPVQAV